MGPEAGAGAVGGLVRVKRETLSGFFLLDMYGFFFFLDMFLLISKNTQKDQMLNFWLQKTLTVLFFEQALQARDHGKCW